MASSPRTSSDTAVPAPAGVEEASESRSPLPVTPPPGLENQDAEAEENYKPRTFKFWSVVTSAFLCLFLISLDRTIIGTAIPNITQDFLSLGDIGWYGSAYQLTTAASQFVFSKVYKFYDIKWTFLISVFLFEVGSAICGAAPNSISFILGRAVAGIGGSGIFSGVTIIIFHLVPLRKQPLFQGIFGGVFGLASVLGPLLGGAFTTGLNWRWCFWINLPIGAVALVCVAFCLHPIKRTREPATIWEQFIRLDPLGTMFFIPSIVSLLVALQWGGSIYAWSSWRVILLLVMFGVLFFAFAAVQVLLPNTATVPARIITQRSILAAAVFMFALAGSMFLAIYYLPLWFQVVLGASAIQSGVYTLPFVLSLVASANISGILTKKIGYYVPAMILCPSLMAVGLGLMTTFRVNESSSHWIGFQFIAGLGLGFGIQASNLATRAVLPMADVSTGIAIIFFSQQVGGAIFTSVGQSLLTTYMVSHLSGVPGIDPSQLSNEGATDLVADVPIEYQPQVKEVYNQAITRVFMCAMGVALVAVVASLFMEWKDLNNKTKLPGSTGAGESAATQVASDLAASRSTITGTMEDLHRHETGSLSNYLIFSKDFGTSSEFNFINSFDPSFISKEKE
ncbi:putative aflatoxin efflux pump [Biscogniauxia sp. FL1348]|nr:putative aflatoxin efflux pump [Biscogniauxia sp. FL1348]